LPEDVDVDGGLRKKLLLDEFDKEDKFKVFSFSFRCFISIGSRSSILRQGVAEEKIVFSLPHDATDGRYCRWWWLHDCDAGLESL
jgi:hypothetical protein